MRKWGRRNEVSSTIALDFFSFRQFLNSKTGEGTQTEPNRFEYGEPKVTGICASGMREERIMHRES